jgi:hypothetical protein
MGQSAVTSDLFYDLVSIQYHALKGQEVYSKFTQDAQGQQDIASFFEEVKKQDIARAERCHEFLMRLTQGQGTGQGTQGGGGTQEPYPSDGQQGTTQQQGQTTGAGTR